MSFNSDIWSKVRTTLVRVAYIVKTFPNHSRRKHRSYVSTLFSKEKTIMLFGGRHKYITGATSFVRRNMFC